MSSMWCLTVCLCMDTLCRIARATSYPIRCTSGTLMSRIEDSTAFFCASSSSKLARSCARVGDRRLKVWLRFLKPAATAARTRSLSAWTRIPWPTCMRFSVATSWNSDISSSSRAGHLGAMLKVQWYAGWPVTRTSGAGGGGSSGMRSDPMTVLFCWGGASLWPRSWPSPKPPTTQTTSAAAVAATSAVQPQRQGPRPKPPPG
mmetsp:Transcript_4549/g.13430  ORF Transcript_4549/g.13430 Transcript_4549/m.13430 type:complete len:203 (-) Transcript_4549:193-801(-)